MLFRCDVLFLMCLCVSASYCTPTDAVVFLLLITAARLPSRRKAVPRPRVVRLAQAVLDSGFLKSYSSPVMVPQLFPIRIQTADL